MLGGLQHAARRNAAVVARRGAHVKCMIPGSCRSLVVRVAVTHCGRGGRVSSGSRALWCLCFFPTAGLVNDCGRSVQANGPGAWALVLRWCGCTARRLLQPSLAHLTSLSLACPAASFFSSCTGTLDPLLRTPKRCLQRWDPCRTKPRLHPCVFVFVFVFFFVLSFVPSLPTRPCCCVCCCCCRAVRLPRHGRVH